MSFSGSQSEPIKNGERQLGRVKTHLGRSPQGVFCVQYCLVAGHVFGRDGSRNWPPALSSQPACAALVDTSVYLKPAKLLNVALDMLAGLAPCLNLGVGELRHKDLLDTIGADNRGK